MHETPHFGTRQSAKAKWNQPWQQEHVSQTRISSFSPKSHLQSCAKEVFSMQKPGLVTSLFRPKCGWTSAPQQSEAAGQPTAHFPCFPDNIRPSLLHFPLGDEFAYCLPKSFSSRWDQKPITPLQTLWKFRLTRKIYWLPR